MISSGMDDVIIKKGDFGFTLSFTGAPSGWTSDVYLVVWSPNDASAKTSYSCTPNESNWDYTVQKGDFGIVGKFYYELTCKITDTIEESTNTGNLKVEDSPVLHT